jgi:hypothetical protein
MEMVLENVLPRALPDDGGLFVWRGPDLKHY